MQMLALTPWKEYRAKCPAKHRKPPWCCVVDDEGMRGWKDYLPRFAFLNFSHKLLILQSIILHFWISIPLTRISGSVIISQTQVNHSLSREGWGSVFRFRLGAWIRQEDDGEAGSGPHVEFGLGGRSRLTGQFCGHDWFILSSSACKIFFSCNSRSDPRNVDTNPLIR